MGILSGGKEFLSVLFPEKSRRVSSFPSEYSVKIGNIRKTADSADLRNGVICIFQQIDCLIDPVFQKSLPHGLQKGLFVSGEQITSGEAAFGT